MDNNNIQDINRINNEGMLTTSIQTHILPSKEFVERSSLLDDLMENKHILTVYRLCLALLLGSVIHLGTMEYFYNGKLNFGQTLILKGIEDFHKFTIVWVCSFLCDLSIYYGFKYWATIRTGTTNSIKLKIWDYTCLVAFSLYLHGRLWISTWVTLKQEMSIPLRIGMTVETIRMLMKLYAFVRSNIHRLLKHVPDNKDSKMYPSFSQFMYFLWIPTLIYRDTYPRTNSIRWKSVAFKVGEFIAGLLFISVTLERYIVVPLNDYGKRQYSWPEVVVIFSENAICGMLILLIGFYIVLHVWMGAFAEICRFGDRQFYQDWWTSSNYKTFFRTWNGILHDWLYTYIYKDFYEVLFPGNKIAARCAVFFLSAVLHEYILYVSFGFVLPVVFVLFFVMGTIFMFIKIKPDELGNVLILYSMGLASGVSITTFGMEYFSRLNCPIENITIYTYLIPRLFSCGIR